MSDKSLKSKAINIKGKEYVLVADRITFFNENYPDGSIETELLSQPEAEHIVIKAIVRPDASERKFVGHSQAKIGDGYINKTAALENAETSAVGRALAMMGIGVIESIASADEINKATGSEGQTLSQYAKGQGHASGAAFKRTESYQKADLDNIPVITLDEDQPLL